MPLSGVVTTIWRRSGTMGRSTPASAATVPAHGPAALTTVDVAMVPAGVSTAATRPAATRMPVTSISVKICAPSRRAPAA